MGKYIFSFYLLIVVSVSSAQEYNPDSVRGMVNKAAQLQKEGEYVEALIGFERALFIADSIKDNKSIYDCIVNLGSLFYEWNDIQKAKIYYKKAVDIALIIEDKKILAGAYNNIGVIVSEENSWDSSLIYYQKAKSLYEELNDSAYLAGTINNIGNVYTYKEDFEKSISYYKKAYKIMSLVDRESDAAVFALNVAGSYRTIGQADSALLYLNIGDKIARGLNSILLDIKVAGSFAHFYENSEDYEIANKYIKEYYNLNDSLFSLEKQKQIVSLQEKYKTEKQKTTIDLLKKEKEIDRSSVISVRLRKE